VNPIEYINYYNNDGFSIDPFNIETQTHDEALYILFYYIIYLNYFIYFSFKINNIGKKIKI